MNRRISIVLIFTLCLLVLIVTACSEEDGSRSSLRLNMANQEALGRTLVPEDTPLYVSRYVVEGSGPQGSGFSVVSTSSNVEVQGLLIGNWQVSAVAQNAIGIDLMRGDATVTLTKEPTEAVIELDNLVGKGVMNITFYWDSSKVNDASLSVWLTDSEGDKRLLTPKTNNSASGSVIYQSTLDAGSYTLQAQLSSGSLAVAGCAEVVRIVGARTTEASIELKMDKYAEVPHSFLLIDRLGVPVECMIEGISETMVAQQSATATIVTNSGENLELEWYLDGYKVGDGLTFTFTPTSGNHRLDVIAKGALIASSGSASISFNAKVEGQTGVPTLVNTVEDNTDGICIGPGAKVAFLPDGKFLLASDTHKTLQVCRIVRDSVEVIHTYSTADQFNVNGVADMLVDQLTYRVAISNTVNPKTVFYQYDLSTSSLIKIIEKENVYGSAEWGTGTYPYLHHLSLDRSGGVLLGLHPTKEMVVTANFYAHSAEEAHNPYYYEPFFGDEVPFDAMDFSPSGEYSALSKSNISELRLYQKIPFGIEFFSSVEIFDKTETPYLTGVNEVRFLDDANLIYATNKDLGRFERVGTNQWQQREVFTSNVGETVAMNQIISLKRATGGTRLYVLCSGSRNMHTFTFSTSEGLATDGVTSLGSFTPLNMDVSPKSDHIIVTSANSATLQLYKIPE